MRKLIDSVSGASQIAVHILLYPLLWRWRSTEEERSLGLPGDEFVAEPQWTYNHSISIDAPRSAVWPWLLQLGQGRGGFYSVMEIRPELQQLRVGETIVTHGRSGYGPPVTRIEPGRSLVLGGPGSIGRGRTRAAPPSPCRGPFIFSMARARPRGCSSAAAASPIGFVMSKRMLRTTKQFAEASSRGGKRRARRDVSR
jgi:hypothetical protein